MALIFCSWQLHILNMLFLSSVHLSFSQSNIETFYPFHIPSHSPIPSNQIPIFPPFSPSHNPTKQPQTHPNSSPNNSTTASTTIPQAVALTAASTLVFSALLFFLLRRCSAARRPRKRYYAGGGPRGFVVPHYESWPTKEFSLLKEKYAASQGKIQENVVNMNSAKDSSPGTVAPMPMPSPPLPPPPPVPAQKNSALLPKGEALKHPDRRAKGMSSELKQREDLQGRIGGQVKLKPLHWDKLNIDTNHSMVWSKIEGGSFRYDGDLMEALFGCAATKRIPEESSQMSQIWTKMFILDTKKSQNAAIVLKSLSVTLEETVEALREGEGLDSDSLEKLAKIAPTKEELSRLLEFDEDPARLAYAESFLYFLLKAVPSAFTRVDAMLFKLNYDSEILHFKECLKTLELACKELQNQGLFTKILEAILKAGNRLNAGTARGNAQGFNLSALPKLSDVKSTDGKTTLLHFVVREVVRSEGKRCATLSRNNSNRNNVECSDFENIVSKDEREKEYTMLGLPVIGGLSSELSNVKKAATIDHGTFAGQCSLLKARVSAVMQLISNLSNDENDEFITVMKSFLEAAGKELEVLKEEQDSVLELITRTTLYYQAGFSKDKGGHPFELFLIIKKFLSMVDHICVEIARNLQRSKSKNPGFGHPSPGLTPSRTPVTFPKLSPNFFPDEREAALVG